MVSENEKQILRSTFFDNAELHFILFDSELNILDANESLFKFYHIDREAFIGKHILEVSPDADKKGLVDKYTEVIRTGKPIIIEEVVSDPIYGNQYNRVKAFKVGNGVGVAISNITEYRNTIESLEVFSYRLSHDIKSPMTSVLELTKMALQEDPVDIDTLKSYCGLINESVSRLLETVEQVNKSLKIQKEIPHFELIDFRTIIDEVKKSLASVEGYSAQHFEEIIDLPFDFYFDKSIITSLFQNIIDNAIKYRNIERDDSSLKINISGDKEFVKIILSDNGIGIKKELQKNIFKLFYRATSQAHGTGIGLYTLRYTIEKLGGRIFFESIEGQGTTFKIIIPNKIGSINPVV